MFEIDDNLRNVPAPAVSPLVQEQLTSIGSLNRFGEPNLRWIWPPTELTFACNRMIPKYRVGIKKDEIRKFRIRDAVANETRECTYGEAKAAWETPDPEHPQIPEVCREIKLEPIGVPRFVIEQYFPPEKIRDTPENWQLNRFKMWFDPELGKEVMTDMIGEYPSRGRYEGFYLVRWNDGSRWGRFRELDMRVVEDVQRIWRERERWHQTKSAELMLRDEFAEAEARDEAEILRVADEITQQLQPHWRRFWQDMPRLFMHQGDPAAMNKLTRFGRAR